jgi:GNAT superfamily N-acetyltransferase
VPRLPTGLPLSFRPSSGAIDVRQFQARDEPEVLALLQTAFGGWPHDVQSLTPDEFFRWKHMDCPFGRSILVVAETDGAVVGFEGHLPWRLQAGEKVLQASRGTDLSVHPSYRRRGVSVAIRGAAAVRLSSEVALTWSNPNKQSRPGSLRFGRSEVGRVARFVQARGAIAQTLGRARHRGANTPDTLEIEAPAAGEVLSDDEYVSSLLSQTSTPEDRLATVKDLDYLRWRYGQLEEYRAIALEQTEGGGIVIFRVRRHGSFWGSHVCELFVERNDRRLARRLLRQVRHAASTDFILCAFSSRLYASMCGFVQFPGGRVLVTLPLRDGLVPDPVRPESWALSIGDLELI